MRPALAVSSPISRACTHAPTLLAAHHAPTFLAEYDAFRTLLQEGKQFEVDPLWLSVLFLTLAHAANALDYVPPGSDFTADELTQMVPDYFEAGRAALDCGDAMGVARLRSIQAVILLGPLALNSGDPGRVDVLLPYVAANVRVAQQLRLDKLGSDPASMPPEDPALPTGKNTLRREVALRLFHALLHLDQVVFRVSPVLPLHLGASPSPRRARRTVRELTCRPSRSLVLDARQLRRQGPAQRRHRPASAAERAHDHLLRGASPLPSARTCPLALTPRSSRRRSASGSAWCSARSTRR